MTLAENPRERIGANGGPPMEEEMAENVISPRHLMIAWRSLRMICIAVGDFDPEATKAKRQGGDYMKIRNLWLTAMKPHIPNNVLAKIAQLNRKTVTGYIQQMERHAERNGLIRTYTDMLADMVEPLPGLIDDGAEVLEDIDVEVILDRSLERVRKASKLLEGAR